MSLITMSGRLINVFQTPKGNRDGKDFGGQDKIQVLGAVTLQNGEVKNQLIDLTCHDVSSFEPYVNEEISFPVGVVALAKNQAVFFIPKGAKPDFGGGRSAV